MYKYVRVIFLFAFCILNNYLPAQVISNPQSKTGNYLLDHHILTDKEIIENQKFLEAQKSQILGDNQQAINLFNEVVKINANNDAAWYLLSKIYLKTYRYPLALSHAATALHLAPDNKWYVQQLSDCYAATKRYKDGAMVYENYLKKFNGTPEMYYEWALLLQEAGDFKNAIKVYNNLENLFGANEPLLHEKEKLYLRIGKAPKAITEIEKLNTIFPDNVQYLGELADLYASTKQYDKAIECVKHILSLSPLNDKAYLALSDYYRRIGKDEESFEMLKNAFLNPVINPEIKVHILAIKAHEGEAHDIMITLIHDMLMANPGSADAYNFNGDYLNSIGRDSLAIEAYLTSIRLNPKNENAFENIILYNARHNHKDTMLVYAQRYLAHFQNNINAWYYVGLAHYQLKHYDSSAYYLVKGSSVNPDAKITAARMLSLSGDCYHFLSKDILSDSAFEKALKLDPDDAGSLNNYAYYLALRKTNLIKAADLSKRAINIQPGSPSYLDTYGYILFYQGYYSESKEYIKKALDNNGTSHPDILEHYGDVLYKLGDIDKAVEAWKKARILKHGNFPILDKKISDKKLYE